MAESTDERMPQLIAFDLDYTLWDFWVDTHVSPPVKRDGSSINQVTDRKRHKTPISFYKDVPRILQHLVDSQCHIAACSRTSATDEARQLLALLLLPPPPSATNPKKAIDFFDTLEIYPGSKPRHFEALHRKTGIPYEEMLFFDDEYRNKEVETLGVTMQFVRDGTTWKVFQKGLDLWRKRQEEREKASASNPDEGAEDSE